jgi:RNA binding exosome subunit
MKIAHNVKLSVFCKPEEDSDTIKTSFLKLVPFNLEQEKLALEESNATGFNERKIKIIELTLEKEKHTNKFMTFLLKKLPDEQKQLLMRQLDSRIDNDLYFYIRLDKQKLIEEDTFRVTDSGDCYHIKISVAAFPSTKEKAIIVMKEFLKGNV